MILDINANSSRDFLASLLLRGAIQTFLQETVSLTPKAYSNLPTFYAFNTFSKLSLRLVNVIHYYLVHLSDIDYPAFFNSF